MTLPFGASLLLCCLWSYDGESPVNTTTPDGSSKVSILAFLANWAAPSQQMRPILEDLQATGYHIATLDVDQESDEVRKHHVDRVPTLVILRDGVELDRITGVASRSQLEQHLRRASSSQRTLPAIPPVPTQTDVLPGAENVVTLTRARFRCGAERSQRVSEFLQMELGNRLELKIDGDILVVTGARQDVERIGGLVELLSEPAVHRDVPSTE